MKRVFCGFVALGLIFGIIGQVEAEYIFTTLDVPGSTYTAAHGINTFGQISGQYVDAGGTAHGFLRMSNGGYTTLDVPGATWSSAWGINDSGQIVGRYVDAGGIQHGFLRSGDSYTTIDVPGSTLTNANGISNTGQIVGFYRAGGTTHSYLLSDGTFTTGPAATNRLFR